MSKKPFATTLFLCCFFSQYLFAQSSCGTKVSDAQVSEMIEHNKRHYGENHRVSATTTYVPLAIHILRKDDVTGGIALDDVFKSIDYTNNAFAPINVRFYICGKIEYINSTEFYDISEITEAKYAPSHDVSNQCNIYYGGTVTAGTFSAGGYAYFPGGPLRMMIKNSAASNSKVVPHEMGHFYGLLHTFNNSNSSTISLREKVTRGAAANCTTAGDLICDTPADPYVSDPSYSTYYTNCIYTDKRYDSNNELFVPMTNNTMSYYYGCDNQVFTSGQYAVLQSYLTHSGRINFVCNSTVNAPSNLSASLTKYGIQLNWKDNSTNELGFNVEYATNANGPFFKLASVDSNVTTILYSDLVPATTYYFKVKAVNSASSYSNVETYTTTTLNYCIPTNEANCINYTNKYEISSVGLFHFLRCWQLILCFNYYFWG